MTLTVPYASRRMYEPDGSIAELVRRSGQAQAEGIRRGGDISANMWGNLGQIGSRAVSDYAQQRAQQAEQKRMDDAAAAKARADAPMREEQFKSLQLGNRKTEMDIAGAEAEAQAEAQRAAKMAEIFARDTEPSAKELIVTLGDKRGIAAWEALRTMKDGSEKQFKDQNELLKKGLQGLAALPEEVRPAAYAAMRQNYLGRNLIAEDMAPPEYNPDWFSQALNFGEAPKAPGTRVLTERKADGTEVERIVPDVAGQNVTRLPAPKAAATVDDSDFEDAVQNLMTGNTADKVSIKVRDRARAEARKRGGVDGTGFVPANTTQQAAFTELRDLEKKAARLEELLKDPEITSKLGPGMGSWTSLTKELPLIGANTKVKEAFDLMANLSDTVLRERTGAAASVPEYNRIIGFGVSPTKQPDSNITNLKQMRQATQEALKNMGATSQEKGTPSRKEGESYIEYLKRTNPGG